MSHPNEALAKTLEVMIRTQDLDPAKWLDFPEYGFRQYFLWKNTDTGASIAPYNHLELGQPLVTEYVWGRQVGENTINP